MYTSHRRNMPKFEMASAEVELSAPEDSALLPLYSASKSRPGALLALLPLRLAQ